MRFLTLEQLMSIHTLVVGRYGGSPGVPDLGRLESAIESQTQAVFGEELYPKLEQKAAVIMRNLIVDHAFVDDNKRTAILAGLILIELGGKKFSTKPGELEDFAVAIVTEHLDIDTIATWLQKHTS